VYAPVFVRAHLFRGLLYRSDASTTCMVAGCTKLMLLRVYRFFVQDLDGSKTGGVMLQFLYSCEGVQLNSEREAIGNPMVLLYLTGLTRRGM